MKTNNLFADYLLDESCHETYDMYNPNKAKAFTDFFLYPLSMEMENGQMVNLEVYCPVFDYKYGQLSFSNLGPALTYNNVDKLNPGVIVYNDMTSDYECRFGWCSDITLNLLREFKIKIYSYNICYEFQLHTFSDGFYRYKYGWELGGWYEDWEKEHTLE